MFKVFELEKKWYDIDDEVAEVGFHLADDVFNFLIEEVVEDLAVNKFGRN